MNFTENEKKDLRRLIDLYCQFEDEKINSNANFKDWEFADFFEIFTDYKHKILLKSFSQPTYKEFVTLIENLWKVREIKVENKEEFYVLVDMYNKFLDRLPRENRYILQLTEPNSYVLMCFVRMSNSLLTDKNFYKNKIVNKFIITLDRFWVNNLETIRNFNSYFPHIIRFKSPFHKKKFSIISQIIAEYNMYSSKIRKISNMGSYTIIEHKIFEWYLKSSRNCMHKTRTLCLNFLSQAIISDIVLIESIDNNYYGPKNALAIYEKYKLEDTQVYDEEIMKKVFDMGSVIDDYNQSLAPTKIMKNYTLQAIFSILIPYYAVPLNINPRFLKFLNRPAIKSYLVRFYDKKSDLKVFYEEISVEQIDYLFQGNVVDKYNKLIFGDTSRVPITLDTSKEEKIQKILDLYEFYKSRDFLDLPDLEFIKGVELYLQRTGESVDGLLDKENVDMNKITKALLLNRLVIVYNAIKNMEHKNYNNNETILYTDTSSKILEKIKGYYNVLTRWDYMVYEMAKQFCEDKDFKVEVLTRFPINFLRIFSSEYSIRNIMKQGLNRSMEIYKNGEKPSIDKYSDILPIIFFNKNKQPYKDILIDNINYPNINFADYKGIRNEENLKYYTIKKFEIQFAPDRIMKYRYYFLILVNYYEKLYGPFVTVNEIVKYDCYSEDEFKQKQVEIKTQYELALTECKSLIDEHNTAFPGAPDFADLVTNIGNFININYANDNFKEACAQIYFQIEEMERHFRELCVGLLSEYFEGVDIFNLSAVDVTNYSTRLFEKVIKTYKEIEDDDDYFGEDNVIIFLYSLLRYSGINLEDNASAIMRFIINFFKISDDNDNWPQLGRIYDGMFVKKDPSVTHEWINLLLISLDREDIDTQYKNLCKLKQGFVPTLEDISNNPQINLLAHANAILPVFNYTIDKISKYEYFKLYHLCIYNILVILWNELDDNFNFKLTDCVSTVVLKVPTCEPPNTDTVINDQIIGIPSVIKNIDELSLFLQAYMEVNGHYYVKDGLKKFAVEILSKDGKYTLNLDYRYPDKNYPEHKYPQELPKSPQLYSLDLLNNHINRNIFGIEPGLIKRQQTYLNPPSEMNFPQKKMVVDEKLSELLEEKAVSDWNNNKNMFRFICEFIAFSNTNYYGGIKIYLRLPTNLEDYRLRKGLDAYEPEIRRKKPKQSRKQSSNISRRSRRSNSFNKSRKSKSRSRKSGKRLVPETRRLR
jgi:hypothetical protein